MHPSIIFSFNHLSIHPPLPVMLHLESHRTWKEYFIHHLHTVSTLESGSYSLSTCKPNNIFIWSWFSKGFHCCCPSYCKLGAETMVVTIGTGAPKMAAEYICHGPASLFYLNPDSFQHHFSQWQRRFRSSLLMELTDKGRAPSSVSTFSISNWWSLGWKSKVVPSSSITPAPGERRKLRRASVY